MREAFALRNILNFFRPKLLAYLRYKLLKFQRNVNSIESKAMKEIMLYNKTYDLSNIRLEKYLIIGQNPNLQVNM